MAVAEKVKEKMLMLRSSDNQEFEVKESVAMQSMTLKKMVEDGCADKGIPLPNVTSHILVKVIEYCNKHAEPTGPGDAAGTTNRSAEDELKIFDADFVNVEHSTLLDLILVSPLPLPPLDGKPGYLGYDYASLGRLVARSVLGF